MIALKGEDIQAAIRHDFSDDPHGNAYHLDRPLSLLKTGTITLDLNQCIVSNDPKYAKLKADLVIPLLDFQITDYRLLKLIKLILTLPIPKSHPPHPSAFIDVSHAFSLSLKIFINQYSFLMSQEIAKIRKLSL